MSSETITSADHKMGRAVEAMERDFQAFRTGRASTALVERLTVDYYGTQTPLNQLAGISVPEAHQIVIQPWDRAVLGAIEKAIQKSELGLVPNVDGTVVRLNIPPLTEERRKDLVKSVHKRMEDARVEIRNLRREAADDLKKEERDGDVGHRRVPSPARSAPEDDRSMDRRGRPPRRRQGTGGHGGLVAGPPARSPDRRAADGASAERRGRRRPRARRPSRRPSRLLPEADLPRHVAIIMDGNRRWARQRGLPEVEGHAAGRRGDPDPPPPRGPSRRPGRDGLRLQPRELGPLRRRGPQPVRPPRAGDPRARRAELKAQGVRIRLLGRLDELPDDTRRSIDDALEETAGGSRLLLNVAFNYAGRTELVDAFRRIAASGADPADRSTRPRSPTRSTRPACPDPDLVIRTGGEQRLSNFLIWQAAYAELYTTEVLWPDFGADAFDAALLEFASRDAPLRTLIAAPNPDPQTRS